jgi:hypothetical protein
MLSVKTLLTDYIFNFIFNMLLNVFNLDFIELKSSKFFIKSLLNAGISLNFPVFKFFNGGLI